MAVTGIPLDMTTLMVASVAIGIGVDDSIHFLLQYRKQLERTEGTGDPLRNTLHIAGRPIILTSTSIVGGILVLCLSSFKPYPLFQPSCLLYPLRDNSRLHFPASRNLDLPTKNVII